jgi:DNA adenine methylase
MSGKSPTKKDRLQEKTTFATALAEFVKGLSEYVSAEDGQWTVKGFIDIFKNIYTISSDTKIVSKILEIHLFPRILQFAQDNGYKIVLAEHQNWYPDLSFVKTSTPAVKFALDLKTTYRDPDFPGHVNGFTLGSHGAYFKERASTKNIQFPYADYSGHFCLGIIYTRTKAKDLDETEVLHVKELDEHLTSEPPHRYRVTDVDNLRSIASVVRDFQFFVCEKWRLASDRQGSGNTANIGSITFIEDILAGNGMFAKLGEECFDEYWMNYGIATRMKKRKAVPIRSLSDCADEDKKESQEGRRGMKLIVPPIKSQGIKTKLVPWIRAMLPAVHGRWIEPFLGTGVVAFNSGFKDALLCDVNPHLINFYQGMKNGEITPELVREYLEKEGKLLEKAAEQGYTHFRLIRDRFNKTHDPLDFLFLSRAGFNGMIRFNRSGEWNIPFCKKPERFARAYITKIVNQVQDCAIQPGWIFKIQDFEKTILEAKKDDIIYCDPPYIGRYVDYYNGWSEEDEQRLFSLLSSTPAKFILSTWHHNDYRANTFILSLWSKFHIVTRDHFYHSGGKIENRRSIVEALVSNFTPKIKKHNHGIDRRHEQMLLQEDGSTYIMP